MYLAGKKKNKRANNLQINHEKYQIFHFYSAHSYIVWL